MSTKHTPTQHRRNKHAVDPFRLNGRARTPRLLQVQLSICLLVSDSLGAQYASYPAIDELDRSFGNTTWLASYRSTIERSTTPSLFLQFNVRAQNECHALLMTRRVHEVFDEHWEKSLSATT